MLISTVLPSPELFRNSVQVKYIGYVALQNSKIQTGPKPRFATFRRSSSCRFFVNHAEGSDKGVWNTSLLIWGEQKIYGIYIVELGMRRSHGNRQEYRRKPTTSFNRVVLNLNDSNLDWVYLCRLVVLALKHNVALFLLGNIATIKICYT